MKPLSPTDDLDRISPYTISTISSTQVMRVTSVRGLMADPIGRQWGELSIIIIRSWELKV